VLSVLSHGNIVMEARGFRAGSTVTIGKSVIVEGVGADERALLVRWLSDRPRRALHNGAKGTCNACDRTNGRLARR
jgi:hypothetical protein